MIYPDFLKQGSCIGVPAPSSGAYNNLYNNRYNNAKKKLEEKGYKVVLSKNIFNSYKMRSAPAKERAEELNKMIENKDINFIICAAGGEFLVEMLPYVNLQKIQTNPKFIQGFSDPTGILFPVTTKYDIATIYGNNFGDYGAECDDKSILDNLKIITGNIIKQKNLNRYFLSLLKNPSFEMKTFDKEKDEDLYSYFLPKVRNTMFWTMGLNRSKLTKFYDLDVATQATLLTEYPCTMFEYSLNEDIQGKAGKRDGIFFDITNITLVCFNTGICFMLMKTMLEGENSLANICNFNYKFRDIKSEAYDYRGYENIKIQTDRFNTIKEITDLITEITGENKEAAKMNIDTNRFITYSYACIGQEDWNDNTNIELLQKEFYKFVNVEKADYIVDSCNESLANKVGIVEKSKNEIYGCSNVGTVLLTSDINLENCTKRQSEFERQYLYQYIYNLYKKISLKKLNYDFEKKSKSAKEEFIKFAQTTWIEEITNDNLGSLLQNEWTKTLKMDAIFKQVKNKYDLLYKNLNIEKTASTNKIIVAILAILLIMNIISIFKIF